MQRIRALIVDDEPLARREMRRLLAEHDWIEVVAESAHVAEAIEHIQRLEPDVLFLDIHMPGGSGFDLLDRLDHAPQVVFTTAYDEHAVRAFEVSALDYLLKPVEPERLAAALMRVRHALAAADRHAPATMERLFVRDGDRCWFVPLREVRLISSEGNHVRLSWGGERPLLARPLAALEPRLDPERFFRANRAQIINLDFIEAVDVGTGGRLHAHLRGGPEIEISRRQAQLFKRHTMP